MKNTNVNRITVVDALRGTAIFGILMVHCLEHFNYYVFPPLADNELLRFSDSLLSNLITFIFSNKAYATFSLLFGLSFFIQDESQLKRGSDFRFRFLWRLVLLFCWGMINAMFYTGDVLVLFSFVGVLLVATARLSSKKVLGIAIFLFLMPLQWFRVIYKLINSDFIPRETTFWDHYLKTEPVLRAGNLLDTMKMGLWDGELFSFLWWVEEGRVFQVGALFLLGMLIGRFKLFTNTEKNIRFWIKTLIIGILCYFPLEGLTSLMNIFVENDVIKHNLEAILTCYSSFAFLCFLVALFVLLYYKSNIGKFLSKMELYGRMSLTMYVSQSIMGGFVFYNWGLGLADKLSATESIFVGLIMFAIQYSFACLWLRYHKQGPLEYVWKKATWIGKKK